MKLGYGSATAKELFIFSHGSRVVRWEPSRRVGCPKNMNKNGNWKKLG
jgi:hypothetical protein